MGMTEPTPPLSDEGSREVEEEMSRPPADTPERRRTIEGVREILAWRKRQGKRKERDLKPSELRGFVGSTERTPPLSDEGSREVEEEMSRPPADTPERRRMFELVRQWAEIRRRDAERERSRDPGSS